MASSRAESANYFGRFDKKKKHSGAVPQNAQGGGTKDGGRFVKPEALDMSVRGPWGEGRGGAKKKAAPKHDGDKKKSSGGDKKKSPTLPKTAPRPTSRPVDIQEDRATRFRPGGENLPDITIPPYLTERGIASVPAAGTPTAGYDPKNGPIGSIAGPLNGPIGSIAGPQNGPIGSIAGPQNGPLPPPPLPPGPQQGPTTALGSPPAPQNIVPALEQRQAAAQMAAPPAAAAPAPTSAPTFRNAPMPPPPGDATAAQGRPQSWLDQQTAGVGPAIGNWLFRTMFGR